jgi:hypothetical protein
MLIWMLFIGIIFLSVGWAILGELGKIRAELSALRTQHREAHFPDWTSGTSDSYSALALRKLHAIGEDVSDIGMEARRDDSGGMASASFKR